MLPEKYKTLGLSKNDIEYFSFHEKRYNYLINILKNNTSAGKHYKVLDVGASFQTLLIRDNFSNFKIDTLGFLVERFKPSKNSVDHIFDLNYSDTEGEKLAKYFQSYDIIIFAEVIEHLRTKPEKTFNLLNNLLKKDGKLIIQTPNAAFLGNRLKLLAGKNPYMRIRDEINNPGHYREYTIAELKEMSNATGFDIIFWSAKNYFNHQGFIKKIGLLVTSLMPESFKNGFSVVLKKR